MEKKEKRLLVIPIVPGNEYRSEIIRAINYQILRVIDSECISYLDFNEEITLYKSLPGNNIDVVKDCSWLCKGYKDLVKRYDEILPYVDNVLIYNFPVMEMKYDGRGGNGDVRLLFHKDNILLELDKCHRKDDYGFVNVGTRKGLRTVLSRIILFECLGKCDIPVFHYVIDPRENDLSFIIGKDHYHRMGALKSTVGASKQMPFFEWGLNEIYSQDLDKSKDLYYITRIWGVRDRQRLRGICDSLNESIGRRGTGLRNTLKGYASAVRDMYSKNFNGNNSGESQEKYYYHLKISRYTFVNQPYIRDAFNYQRFMEAIILGAIPLFEKGTNYDDLILTYPEFYDIIKKEKLEIDLDEKGIVDLRNRMYGYMENGDNEIINKFKNTKAYKSLMDADKIKSYWKKKLRW